MKITSGDVEPVTNDQLEFEIERRKQNVKALRDLAYILESNNAIPIPFFYIGLTLSKDDFLAAVRAIGTRGEKSFVSSYAQYEIDLGPFKYSISTEREGVCRKVATGETFVVPAQPATPEYVEVVYKWKCDPWFGSNAKGESENEEESSERVVSESANGSETEVEAVGKGSTASSEGGAFSDTVRESSMHAYMRAYPDDSDDEIPF